MENTGLVLLLAFGLSVLGLMVFIWSMSKGFFGSNSGTGANVIFGKDEIGLVEDPAVENTAELQGDVGETSASLSVQEIKDRQMADASSALPAFAWITGGVVWLVLASFAGLISSIKLHQPDWLTDQAWLTFGRLRVMHLTGVGYGWSSMVGIGVALWMIPRLLKTPLVGAKYALWGALFWHVGVILGENAIAQGYSAGMEWLEIPWQIGMLFVVGGALAAVPLFKTFANRNVDHLYVSVWYIGGALIWFPILFFIANLPGLGSGAQGAAMNWWFGHNVLGLWFTPLALATAYYFIPKVLGKPIYSYNLSLLGFWSLAFFYSQVGGHHLIGGPLPSWLITLSIVQSVMMIIPVYAVAVNHHMTVGGNFKAVIHSPTLRFIVLGSMLYVAASVQGSMEALRFVNQTTHFTHFTVAHAHLGNYGFFTMIMFGAIYFIMPRVVGWEWPYPWMISAHFWLVTIGFAIYFIGLSIGGWLQGRDMLDAAKPFMDSVLVTIPYLKARSVGGSLMVLGHLVFAVHFILLALRYGSRKTEVVLAAPFIEKLIKSRVKGA
ncbi:MAG: cbb3-type cytochrome c oxidase subunit I [Methylophilaceae bacterium]|nr:cbb3-type cytochrome c oxidase subunit I [Methylophilaceae bacterium]